MTGPTLTTVIFVDDEPAVLDGIRRMLTRVPHHWKAVYTGSVDEALAKAEADEPALIITDMTMRGKTGMDLIHEVQRRAHLRHVPVVVLTGSSESDLKRRALESGALDLINKPVSREDLIARISSALRVSLAERKLHEHAAVLEQRVKERTQHLEHARCEIVWRLAKAGEMRDTDTGDHVVRVANCSALIARAKGLPLL